MLSFSLGGTRADRSRKEDLREEWAWLRYDCASRLNGSQAEVSQQMTHLQNNSSIFPQAVRK